MHNEDDLSIDDMLDGLGAPDVLRGMTPEQRFYTHLTTGKHTKLYNCRYWLDHELSVFNSLNDKNWFVSKLSKTTEGATRVQVPLVDLSRALLQYYFQMIYLTMFTDTHNRPACNMDTLLDLVMGHEEIKRTINQYQ